MAENQKESSLINNEFNSAKVGLDQDSSLNQVGEGKLTYALNAVVENFDANSISYQNEPGNEFCLSFPEGYSLIGQHYIQEKNKHLYFLVNEEEEESEIGYMDNNDCVYRKLVNNYCLNFKKSFPIHKVVHKITNCGTEIYWPDNNGRRYLDIDNIPYILREGSELCDPKFTDQLDCNQLKMQPNFDIPEIDIKEVVIGGENLAGTYQFAAQYGDASGNPYTSYYSVTNPLPIGDERITTPNFNYNVGKSIVVEVSNLDGSGQFEYFNLAVIKTINNIPSVELVGTYFIDKEKKRITYTGQKDDQIRLSMADIFEKHPYYDLAKDVTAVQDVLIWDQLTTIDQVNYQSIASKINLYWETYKLPAKENYANELNALNLRGYLRDEVYTFELVFLLKNGKQTDKFHIPGRALNPSTDLVRNIYESDPDFVGQPLRDDNYNSLGYSPYWKIYNTASVIGNSESLPINNATAHQYGNFAYIESEDTYPCNEELWGELAGKPVRHHKFPDVNISPIFESGDLVYTSTGDGDIYSPVMENKTVYPIGVRIDAGEIKNLISGSDLTQQQKKDIIGFKIVRGDRGTNKSIIAKGILRNVNSYEREDQTYYYPNYPYNDLEEDPFINSTNNAYSDISEPWLVTCLETGTYKFGDPNNNREKEETMIAGVTYEFCSTTRPVYLKGKARIGPANYDIIHVDSRRGGRGFGVMWDDPFSTENLGFTSQDEWLENHRCLPIATLPIFDFLSEEIEIRVSVGGGWSNRSCVNKWNDLCKCKPSSYTRAPIVQPEAVIYGFTKGSRRSSLNCKGDNPIKPIKEAEKSLSSRQVFNSPETSFGQPFLGDVLKLESVVFGGGKAHFVEVRDNAKYKLLTEFAQRDALKSAGQMANISNPYNVSALFAAYQSYLIIYTNGITRKNYAYSYNSIADYNQSVGVPDNLGVKQRVLDIKKYLIPGVQSVGDINNVNNYRRESSVYLKTLEDKPVFEFPSDSVNLKDKNIVDKSRMSISSSKSCSTPGKEKDITVVSYYASIKNVLPSQWGQVYSYESVDTGFQVLFNNNLGKGTVFGGDTFISRFSFKTKLPFFIDNRVNAPDDSDIFYDEIGNVGYPRYWHSARSILKNYTYDGGQVLYNFISYKANHFDCPNDPESVKPSGSVGASGTERTYYNGYFYLFAYGQPNFYCETSYNLDLRQAFNNKEGDFWPHVSTGIPDDWVQESFVTIAQDNSYYYNVTFSKQNKENTFTELSPYWKEVCYTNFPFRAIYSNPQNQNADVRINNWLTYLPLSKFDLPQNNGKLISLDGIENKAILARFENKSLLYNNLLTLDTSNPQAAYLGNPNLFAGAPPIDFAETDLGYVGSQNKVLLKIPQGKVTIDAKRGQIFLIQGGQAVDLCAYGSGMNRFFTDHLSFEILRHFHNVPTDNHFNGIGLHGVYDTKFERIILTKLDYIPIDDSVVYDDLEDKFYSVNKVNEIDLKTEVYLTDTDYFCNKSWTVSFNFNTKSWVSYHNYLPNFYVGENNFFYSGLNGGGSVSSGEFSALVGDTNKVAPSTTTTTTRPVTTTSTTTKFIDDFLSGRVMLTNSVLEGTAEITVPPITTTTVCSRPSGLKPYFMIYGFKKNGVDNIINNSFEAICNLNSIIKVSGRIVELLGYSAQADSLSVDQLFYKDSKSKDCELIESGWYLTEESRVTGRVFYISQGVLTEISECSCATSTETTTSVPVIEECCGILFATSDNIKYLDYLGNKFNLYFPGYVLSEGVAMTSNKFWSVDTTIKEWDILTYPFSSTYFRDIALPAGISLGNSVVAKNNNTLLGFNKSTSPEELVSLDISGVLAISSTLLSFIPNRTITTNLMLTTDGNIVFGSQDITTLEVFISQINLETLDISVDELVTVPKLVASYECECVVHFVDINGIHYQSIKVPYFDLIPIPDLFIQDIYSVTQIGNCSTSSLLNSTTTSTTTMFAPLKCYTITGYGGGKATWTDENYNEIYQVLGDESLYICAVMGSITVDSPEGDYYILGGILSCIEGTGCVPPPTTTSTTTL